VAVDPSTGRDRLVLELTSLASSAIRDVERVAGRTILVTMPAALAAFDPGTARLAWSFAPPGAVELRASSFGPLVLAASDTGFLYALDALTGQPRWRVHLPGRVVGLPIAFADTCVVTCETALGGSLVSLDPATGHRRFEVPLDVSPTGAPVPFAGLLGVPGTVAGDALVTAVDPAGELVWEEATGLGSGPVALAALPSALLAKTADGACTALDRSGQPLWSRPAISDQLAAANPPPVVARGVALVPSQRVEAIDPQSGALLGELPVTEPIELICGASLDAWGIDADGLVTAARLETHLSLIRGRA
jgi:outer membrane protein assembly factor BamB